MGVKTTTAQGKEYESVESIQDLIRESFKMFDYVRMGVIDIPTALTAARNADIAIKACAIKMAYHLRRGKKEIPMIPEIEGTSKQIEERKTQ